MSQKNRRSWFIHLYVGFFLAALTAGGCAHYPPNSYLKEVSPEKGYRLKSANQAEKSDELLLFLTFSGGGTRAASLAYGVLEELDKTEIRLDGRNRSLLDEVDVISSVSGGSFTAAYYGLFGRRIFEDFENRFLKKNIQKELFEETLFSSQAFKLLSSKFGRSDLAAEYYDENIFEGSTFSNIAARGGPHILINATDLTLGTYFTFSQEIFDIICSDISSFPVARAVAASSAVPVLLTPITLYNYAGSCNYEGPGWMKEVMERKEESSASRRRFLRVSQLRSYMDIQKRPYIHVVDGGISDNLGLRVAIDYVTAKGDMWRSLQYLGWGNTRKVVFIMVNAEQESDAHPDYVERVLSTGQVLKEVTNTPIVRYNFETIELLKANFKQWAEEIRSQRCVVGKNLDKREIAYPELDSCADIRFYLVEVDFDALSDNAERSYLRKLPTSFHLPPEAVDRLRSAGRRILKESPEFQRLLLDLKKD
jgi:NTE family protein